MSKIDPRELNRARQQEELDKQLKNKRKHITLLESLQKMGQKRAEKPKNPPSKQSAGKESIKEGLAKLIEAG